MAERSSLNQIVQVGAEATAGIAVAANRRLASLSIEPSPKVSGDTFRPAGQKYIAMAITSKEWTEAGISGRATYTEMVYPFASVLTRPTITTPDAAKAPNMRLWTYEPSSTADDQPVTFTVEHGSSVRADSFSNAVVTEFGLTISRETVEVKGSLLGRAITDNIVMTSTGVESLELTPCLPTQATIYMDDTHEALGTTVLTRLLSCEWNLGSRFSPLWVINAALSSYAAVIETAPDLTSTITVEADAQGMAFLDTLRAGDTKFLRIEFIGKRLGDGTVATNCERVTIDMACKISDTGGFSDKDGVYAVEWSLVGVHDGDWGRALRVEIQNEIDAL